MAYSRGLGRSLRVSSKTQPARSLNAFPNSVEWFAFRSLTCIPPSLSFGLCLRSRALYRVDGKMLEIDSFARTPTLSYTST